MAMRIRNENPQLSNLLRQLVSALAAFTQDMGGRMEDIVLVTMSEFGRTAQENGNQGTDHGHGDLMMVLGGPVRRGKIYGKWPGLEKEQLYEGRDLAVTTDFRDVLGELVTSVLTVKHNMPSALHSPQFRPSWRIWGTLERPARGGSTRTKASRRSARSYLSAKLATPNRVR